MKSKLVLFFLTMALQGAFAQTQVKKLDNEDATKLTLDQRVVHETDRKTKRGKKKMSVAKKVRIEKQQIRRARRTPVQKQKRISIATPTNF